MGQHGPEAAQCFGWDAGTQLRDIALQVGAQKLGSPEAALAVAGRLKAVGEAAAIPELIQRGFANFEHVQAVELETGDPSGEAFTALPQQIHGGGAQQQKLSGSMAGQPVGVDQAAQQAEQLWNALHFIKDHQPAALPLGDSRSR